MTTQERASRSMQLQALCDGVRKYVDTRNYQKCVAMICEAMGEFPNAPQPHNLLGIVMEKEGDHPGAMKHFRAAYALDPTYLPARQNLDHYGTFYSRGGCAYDESDCPQKSPSHYEIEYDEKGIGHAVRRNGKWVS